MPRRRQFVRGAAAIGNRRLTRWLDLIPSRTALDTTGTTILFSLSTEELALRPFTIVRSRFQMGIESDQLAADEFQLGAVGIAVVSEQVEAIGITAVPTPITDLASDLWLQHQFLYSSFGFITGAGFDAQTLTQYSVDSKAMRKVEDGEDVVVVAEASALSFGFILTVGGRILVKLH